MRRTLLASFAAAAAAILPTAHADEVWSTKVGNIVYQDEVGEFAVLTIPANAQGDTAQAFIYGLAGNYDDRYRFEGYWTQPDGPASCAVEIVDAEGNSSANWGRLQLDFVTPAFPSAFILQVGSCFNDPEDVLLATPVTAGDPE